MHNFLRRRCIFWQRYSVRLNAGSSAVQWRYAKQNNSIDGGKFYVDDIYFVPDTEAPSMAPSFTALPSPSPTLAPSLSGAPTLP